MVRTFGHLDRWSIYDRPSALCPSAHWQWYFIQRYSQIGVKTVSMNQQALLELSSHIRFPSSSWPRLVALPTSWIGPKSSLASQKPPACLLASHPLPTLPIDLQPKTILPRYQLHPTMYHTGHNCLQCQLLTINTQYPLTIKPWRINSKTHPMNDNRAWGYS